MRQQVRHQICIVLAAAAVFCTNLGATRLWDQDETIHATCAREMFQRGDWVVPTFNGEPFYDKPPLMFWLMISGFQLFGVTEFAARFWSAVLGIGTALVTYHLGRRLFRAEVGLWAGLIMASTVIFTVSARAATVDSALVFLTTTAMLLFVVGGAARRPKTADASAQPGPREVAFPFRPGRWTVFVLIYALLGLAVLAKGPIGLMLPVATMGLFLLITSDLQRNEGRQPAGSAGGWTTRLVAMLRPLGVRNLLRVAWQMRPLTAIVVVAAVAVPWYFLVGLRTHGAWLEHFFGEHNLQRALRAREGHAGPFFYYILAILIGLFPWSVFLGPSLSELVRRIRRHHAWRAGYILVACWVGVFLVFWSMVSTKLPHYVLPAYPALALLTACFVDGWVANPAHVSRWWARSAMLTLVLVGIGMLVALPILASRFLPGEGPLGLVGLVLVAGGGVCWFYVERGQAYRAVVAFAAASVTFLVAVFGFAALRVDRHQDAVELLAEIRKASPGPPSLATYRFRRESFIFYAGHPVPHCENAERLASLLGSTPCPYVLTSNEYEQEIQQSFPGEFSVLARRPKFLKRGEVVVLARRCDGRGPPTTGGRMSTVRR